MTYYILLNITWLEITKVNYKQLIMTYFNNSLLLGSNLISKNPIQKIMYIYFVYIYITILK
jgi:hypothetical protein